MNAGELAVLERPSDGKMGKLVKAILLILMLIGLPLLGAILIGQQVVRYIEFPPQTHSMQHPPFSWPMFVALALVVLLFAAPAVYRTISSRITGHERGRVIHAFPWWGGPGLALTIVTWVLAWNRFAWFEAFQPFTFTPLWLGYILTVNALTYRRTGRCMMLDRPRYFFWLFPLSAAFWWCFEYLNRFVQNWYYVGPHPFTAWEYFLHATVPFATVLPAVLGTMELLASYPQLGAGWKQLPPLCNTHAKMTGWAMLFLACAGLIGIAIWPSYLFPLVWMAPLVLITSLQMLRREETIFYGIGQGDWRLLWSSAVAALVCGIFWEMWNYKSLSHWEYAIPFVHGFQIFEMPILGYAGYPPFGLECLALAQFLFPESYREMRHHASHRESSWRKENRMVKGIGVGLLLLGLLLIAGRGNAQSDVDVMEAPKSFLSGKDWRGLSKGEQQAYAVGVVDGLELAFVYGKQGADLGWINACVTGMSSEQVRSMLGKETETNPEEWNLLKVHQAMYRALKKTCRQGKNR